MENLSSTQLYGLIVAATVGLCMVVLGTGPNEDWKTTETTPTTTTKQQTTTTTSEGKQPRWHIFKIINVFAMLGFVVSVAAFLLNASTYLESQTVLLRFLVGWSVFLCYFFGFFGISLVHQDIPKEESQSHNNTNPSATSTGVQTRYVRLIGTTTVQEYSK
jgi:hypothetical protein